MVGPQLILAGIVAGLLIIFLLDYARSKCKTDWCITYIIISIIFVIITALLFAVIGITTQNALQSYIACDHLSDG